MGLGFLIPLVIVVGFIYASSNLFEFNKNKNSTGNSKDAIEILRERYARGEFDEEEYERIKNKISQQ